MTSLLSVVLAATPDPDFDPNTVTPGVVGFLVFFLIALATLLLCLDVVRRIRRTTYRAEIKARLDAEVAARDADPSAPTTPSDKPE
ncbi:MULTISPECIES: hypothetical protein [Cryobacterium]|uniref:Uncharacterized protein n=1 Tax=Cryobacterium levicorallinum TaxID=995038 RepID=A0A1I3BIW1_9MICO|nr:MULTISPECIES: hypothetical protein [Cryobacterium]TFB82091.1 hypothetical protein E3O11_15605 [Cryobacterium levicorallinum]TFD57057.1 hypothetical protein E3T41_13690 [Cryobacterium sp. Hh38]GEP28027.1 hypothetical protein CLE01_26250 [Cryobacterium levicorallinum]SFH62046.1 hypothetical protein SAMN05216274_109149 [Cryobacterium levicorallinum]